MSGFDDLTNYIGKTVDPRSAWSGLQSVGRFFDPARPFNEQAAGLDQGAADAKALAALQWQREMQGLSQALTYGKRAQSTIDAVYAPHGPALPVGMMPPAPAAAPAGPPGAAPAGPPGMTAPAAPGAGMAPGRGGLAYYMRNAGGR